MEGVSSVARNGRIKLSIALDDLFDADGMNPAGTPQEAFEVSYARGSKMSRDDGAISGNQTAWSLGQVGFAVRMTRRDWESIDWYWGGEKVYLANPFAG
jgi:hypothetical protein